MCHASEVIISNKTLFPSLLSLSDPVNRQSLEVVETAMFTLCLDRAHPQAAEPHVPLQDPHIAIMAKRCLHGNGTQHNSGNRWFDSAGQVR